MVFNNCIREKDRGLTKKKCVLFPWQKVFPLIFCIWSSALGKKERSFIFVRPWPPSTVLLIVDKMAISLQFNLNPTFFTQEWIGLIFPKTLYHGRETITTEKWVVPSYDYFTTLSFRYKPCLMSQSCLHNPLSTIIFCTRLTSSNLPALL